MFSNHLIQYAGERFQKRVPLLGLEREAILKGISGLGGQERVLMEFLYGTMPLRDAGEYGFQVFLSYVTHALMLRREVSWCRELPEDIFLHHVLYYRINSEDITDCRPFFYDSLRDRVQGKTVEQAVLEVNYWCAEHATYQVSDNRTISPMTVYRSGRGRCGEESTFTVTALRSVGIPARQVYTPRWAHCDDNHAWVEAYVDGRWAFLGACEPEEILDKGWFTGASSRALLVHTRNFCDFVSGQGDECIGREDLLVYYNDTANYARTKTLKIKVMTPQGSPVENVKVSVEILNMAEYHSAVTLFTDGEGVTSLTLGLGDVHVHVEKDGDCAEAMALAGQEELCLTLCGEITAEDVWRDLDVEAPRDCPRHPVSLSREQRERGRMRLARANAMREERRESFYRQDMAGRYPGEQEILRLAAGNFEEIYGFLSRDGDEDRGTLLHSLSAKDYRDARREILEDHLKWAKAFSSGLPPEIYASCVLCPRIYLEEMTPYRSFIRSYFGEEKLAEFAKEPGLIWGWIRQHITFYPELDYKTVCSTPVGCLKLSQGSELSKRILFVAVCRTIGVPARLNRINLEAEYLEGQDFIPVSASSDGEVKETKSATLVLLVEDKSRWTYYQTWTLGVLRDGQFMTLDYTDITFRENRLELALTAGVYRLVTTSRMPNGNQHASERTFHLEAGQTKEISMYLREGNLADMLVRNEIAPFDLTDGGGAHVPASQVMDGKRNLLLFLEEGKEPTEHVLNEMLEQETRLSGLDAQILLVVREQESLKNQTLSKVLKAFPAVGVFFDDFTDHVDGLARRMYVDPEKLPLMVVTSGMTGVYGCSGYNVGSVALAVKILENDSLDFHSDDYYNK